MAEYIEREALIAAFYKDAERCGDPETPWDLSAIETEIECSPAADVVPVVRCRHCRSHHWEQEPCHGKTVHYCETLKAEVTADFFCAAGKRKEADGNG